MCVLVKALFGTVLYVKYKTFKQRNPYNVKEIHAIKCYNKDKLVNLASNVGFQHILFDVLDFLVIYKKIKITRNVKMLFYGMTVPYLY